MDNLQSFLESHPVILADGAMGTMLFEAGLDSGESPQGWNIAFPDRVRKVHREYLDAGSQIVLSNTFGGNRFRLAKHNLQTQVAELNRAGAALLRAEIDQSSRRALAAGDIGPSGELLAPLGKLSYAEAVDAFAEQAASLLSGGVDLIWIETMSALDEVQAAVEGVRKASAAIPVVVTMTFEKHGRTMMGVSPEQALKRLSAAGVSAIGGNCGTGPEELLNIVRTLHQLAPAMPLVFKPNAGVPELVGGKTVYNATVESMAECSVAAVNAGARIVGACCGSTPVHIKAIRERTAPGAHQA